MAKAKKLPSGSWRVNQYIGTDENGNKKFKSFTAATKKEAEYAAAEYVMYRKAATGTNMTVYEAIDEYIASKENILSPSTIQSYHVIRRTRLKSIGNVKLATLTQTNIQKAINIEAAEVAPKTVKNIYALLSAALKQHNISYDIALPQKQKKEIVIPTKEDVEMLLDFPMPEDVRLAIMLAAFMGLRRSEIFALNVRDFNFDKKLLYVNKAMVKSPSGEYVIKTTKTYSGTRSLPIPERMLQELQSYNMTDPLMKRSPNAFTAFFEKTLKKMSIRSFRFHDLRHPYVKHTTKILACA